MKLDFDTLYAEARGQVFRSGKKRYYDNKVLEANLSTKNKKTLVTAKVKGEGSTYDVEIVFDESGGLYEYNCTCGDCDAGSSLGPCRHIVAAALQAEEKYPDNEKNAKAKKEAKTDAAVFALSQEYFKRKRAKKFSEKSALISIEPVLGSEKSGGLYLRFYLGKNKKYLLKDVSDFAAAYTAGANRRYGVDVEFEVRAENFEPQSRRLSEFLIASYKERVQSGLIGNAAHRDELPLNLGDADEFFNMYGGYVLQYEENFSKCGLRLIEKTADSINAGVKIESGDGGYYISTDFYPKATLLSGKKFNYILTDSRIFKVTQEFTNSVWPLMKTLFLHGRLFVLERDMPLIYNSALSGVADWLRLDADNTDLTKYEAAPLSAVLELTGGEGDGIDAKLEAFYDEESVDLLDDNCSVSAVRDFDAEAALTAELIKYFPSYPVLSLSTENDIYLFLKEGAKAIGNYCEIIFADSVKGYKIKPPPRFKIGVKLSEGLLEVETDAEDYTQEELTAILSESREKRSFIRLPDGSFVDLSDPSITALSNFFAVSGRTFSNKMSLPAFYAPFFDNELKSGLFYYERNASFKSLITSLSSASDAETKVPVSLKGILRNYQKTGFRWLKTLSDSGFGGILADDMGLGKSLQIISMLLHDTGGLNIIVCPTSLILNWAEEFSKFGNDLKILPVYGTQNERAALINSAGNYDVVITSYELLRRDITLYKDFNFKYAVLDEAQYIKNPLTKNAQTVKALFARHRFALTGTPIENSLSELWSIFDFIMPGYLRGYQSFKDRFENDIVRGEKGTTAKFKNLVSPFILRRLKSDVLTELPPKIESVTASVLEGKQQELYSANLQLIRDSLLKGQGQINKVAVLGMLTKLRQICCDPKLIYPDYTGNSAKFDTAMELVQSAISGGHKILLFSQFTQMLELFKSAFASAGISYYVLKGDTPKTERMRLVNKFNQDDTGVFLISLKAGGTGLNLTGADIVIHYDPWWNESVTNQATDRAYRIGQEKTVQVYKLVLASTLEEKIIKLGQKKSALSNTVIDGGGSPFSLSVDELIKLVDE